jgi:hypothetical protein
MRGLPLTPQEALASVARRVRRLEAQGLDRDEAIRRAAVETGIDPQKVRWCAETTFPDSTVRLAPPSRPHRRPGHGRRPLTHPSAALSFR